MLTIFFILLLSKDINHLYILLYPNLLASFNKRKSYFKFFSNVEEENKGHNLRIKDTVLSSGRKCNGLLCVPGLACGNHCFRQLPMLSCPELPNYLFPAFILIKVLSFKFSTILK